MERRIAGRFYTDTETRRIQEQYIAEMKPFQDLIQEVLMHARIIVEVTPEDEFIGTRYDAKTQEQIDIITKHIQAVTDIYKKNYPGLFRYC